MLFRSSIVLTSFGGTGTNSMEMLFDSANRIGSNSSVSAEGCQLLFFRSCRLIDRLIDCFNTVTRLPDLNSHSCRILRTNAPWDAMPHLSWLACDPARCVNRAARGPDSSGRSACSMACGNDADCVRFSAAEDFCRDAHIDIRREAQRQTRPRRWSKLSARGCPN